MQFVCYTMQHEYCKHSFFHVLYLWLILVALAPYDSSGESLGLKLIHKYSDEAKMRMMQKYDGNFESWPSIGSRKFYQILHEQDRARHDRKLSTYDTLIFAEGNETAQLGASFGFIFYTVVDLGTPNKTFLVALDTGSDLLWVPCECKQCAPLAAPGYQTLASVMNIYSPTTSTTSKQVSCSDSLCKLGSKCVMPTDPCPYVVQYASANTSTSGTLVKDVMHFTPDDLSTAPAISVPIVFGCGNVQTGSFLEGGSPDGLLGLGLGTISLPSMLAKDGLVQNSFSMCFGYDYYGRIFFGDKGDPSQQTTSFVTLNESSSLYGIALEQLLVGSKVIVWPGSAIFDTGTTFTYLPRAVYRAVTTVFSSQVKLKRIPSTNLSLPFELCYATSDVSQSLVPQISLILHGGGNFTVVNPYIFLVDEYTNNLVGFCLAVLSASVISASVPIIGQNFMFGYSISFNRQDMKLGWLPSDCYQDVPTGGSFSSPVPSVGPIPPPAKSPSPSALESPAPNSAPSVSPPTSSPSSSPSASPSSTSPTTSGNGPTSQQPPAASAPPEKPSFGEKMQPRTFLISAFLVGLILLTCF